MIRGPTAVLAAYVVSAIAVAVVWEAIAGGFDLAGVGRRAAWLLGICVLGDVAYRLIHGSWWGARREDD